MSIRLSKLNSLNFYYLLNITTLLLQIFLLQYTEYSLQNYFLYVQVYVITLIFYQVSNMISPIPKMKQYLIFVSQLIQDKVISKLEQMGYRVGQSLIEKFTRESPRFSSELDIIKFVCKDLWNGVYKKQVDNLRTNHQVSQILLRK